MRTRKKSDLNAEISRASSSALCHLANISYRWEARPSTPGPRRSGDDKEVYETLERMEQHLTGDNGIKLTDSTITSVAA